jgi:hypothetical protein
MGQGERTNAPPASEHRYFPTRFFPVLVVDLTCGPSLAGDRGGPSHRHDHTAQNLRHLLLRAGNSGTFSLPGRTASAGGTLISVEEVTILVR